MGGICTGAEKRGFVLPETAGAGNTVPTRVDQAKTSDEAFLTMYAKDQEIERLKVLLEERNRENAELKRKLNDALDRNATLETRIYVMEGENVPQYEVRKGDSLWKIAKKQEIYGNPRLWIKIFNANMDRIKNPNVIFPGQLLKIPR